MKTDITEMEPPRLAKPTLQERRLLPRRQAAGLAGLFKALASDTRLRMLHALARNGEVRLTDLAREVGMRPQAVSNQMRRLVERGFLASRRHGGSLLYRIDDPCVTDLLDRGLCLLEDARGRAR